MMRGSKSRLAKPSIVKHAATLLCRLPDEIMKRAAEMGCGGASRCIEEPVRPYYPADRISSRSMERSRRAPPCRLCFSLWAKPAFARLAHVNTGVVELTGPKVNPFALPVHITLDDTIG
jgi:hypothetical protein